MLTVSNLEARYGQALILQDVSLAVAQGTVCLLLGRNGAGKSTTVKSLIGLVRPTAGSIRFDGAEIAGEEPYRIARRGIGYVPEERRIFTDLTVAENLQVATRGTGWTQEKLFALFPNLAERRHQSAARMSGGEQQMLAIARTLIGNPTLLLLDEPSEGLSPLIVEQLADALLLLKREGTTMLLAEQNLHFARLVGDDAVILERGRVVWSGPAASLDPETQRTHLAV